MRSGRRYWLLLWAVLLITVMFLQSVILERSRASVLKADVCESPEFRKQELQPKLYEEIRSDCGRNGDFGTLLTAVMLNGNFAPGDVCTDAVPYLRYKRKEFYALRQYYEAVWADVTCFPAPYDGISYEDTWLAPREYGGKRRHEGTDLFGRVTVSGYYPVVSMTDGVVEAIGWLPLGGYRIGIRSAHGGYFYYAHLSQYERPFAKGETVEAGEILGFMGNTGYGEEGTFGKFPVHLHLGIYVTLPSKEELSVNPYWVLKAIEDIRL